MLKKITLLMMLAASILTSVAATNRLDVDINRIKVDVATNPGNFSSLMNRFLIGDTTLTLDEMATVYYGYAFTSDYDPSDHYPAIEKAYGERDYTTTWSLAENALKYNPVSLDLTIKALVAANNSDNPEVRKMIPTLQNRYDLVSTVILSSGMGTTTESPFIVICDEDMGRIVRNVICVESTIGSATVRDLDAIKVKLPTSDRQHILYFDNNIQKNFERSRQ